MFGKHKEKLRVRATGWSIILNNNINYYLIVQVKIHKLVQVMEIKKKYCFPVILWRMYN